MPPAPGCSAHRLLCRLAMPHTHDDLAQPSAEVLAAVLRHRGPVQGEPGCDRGVDRQRLERAAMVDPRRPPIGGRSVSGQAARGALRETVAVDAALLWAAA